MWQALLAAAVAGSGFLAKRLVTSVADPDLDQPKKQPPHFAISSEPQPSTPPTVYSFDGNRKSEPESQSLSPRGGGDGSIFRFSSSAGIGSGGKGENRKGLKNGGGFGKAERKYGKKFVVCVKKRRTSKSAPGKCDSCSSKDNSSFRWGLGVGIMYMMSAGKAEINKLNMAMDDTAKVIQELKAELSKRKSSRHLKFSSSWNELSTDSDKIRGKHIESVPEWSTEDRHHVQDSGFLMNEEGECASVLTEEPQQEVQQMDHLEAELESELQKLSWTSKEASGLEGNTYIFENQAPAGALYKSDGQNCNSYQFNGVLPSELDKKLSHLLIEQQGSHIVELESELHHALSKLHEKEAELQALKDCVRRLTDLSLATASDEETETQIEEENANDGDYSNNMETDSKKAVVGMKRAMTFESYRCRN